jgi:molybdopterin synthase catalytic subunit
MELNMEICTSLSIDPGEVYDMLSKQGVGSVILHFAIVKPLESPDGTTGYIDYAANEETKFELRTIAAALSNEYNLEDVILIRRTGRVEPGEIISLVAASSPNSQDAFAACKQGLARLKKMRTIVKDEVFAYM